jgi:hypothetical protein
MRGVSSEVSFHGLFDAAALVPGNGFDRGCAGGPDFNLDGDQPPTARRQYVDFSGFGSVTGLDDSVSFEAEHPLAEFFGETPARIGAFSFCALLAHRLVPRFPVTHEVDAIVAGNA